LQKELDDLRRRVAELETVEQQHTKNEQMLAQEKERITRLAQTVPDVLYRINMRTGHYEFLSPELEKMLGYPLSEPLERPREFTYRVLHPEDRDRISGEVNEFLATRRGASEPLVVECRMVCRDGKIIWIRDSMRFEWDDQGLAAANGIMSNITEQKKMEEALRALSLMDELTGLYNRRGFFTLAEQEMKIARRLEKEMTLYFIDIDNMKDINDKHGHHEGDKALLESAYIMKSTFRESDVIARIGGDEFVALTIPTSGVNSNNADARLSANIGAFNERRLYPFKISFSVGVAHYDPKNPCTLDELLIRADHLMLEQKRGKK
jgi:diguanylate cyclase (GGDEF)-like protein/PAS domain S-box-containing protein